VSDSVVTHLDQAVEDVLARRAASLAQEAAEDNASDRIALLLFRIGVEWYAVRVEDVRELYQEYEVTPVPCVPDFIQGVVNIRGEILSVVDLAKIMGLGLALAEGQQLPAIVVSSREVAAAMVVDEIGDIIELPHGGIEAPVTIIDRQQAEFVSGSVYVDGTLIGVVSVDRVLEPVGGSSRH
jgi:purine-binding chemotaxis protein CheW